MGMSVYELTPQYDSAQSFYGKAFVEGSKLYSYCTPVVAVRDGRVKWLAADPEGLSNTTWRHVREFLRQNGLRADSKRQVLRDYPKDGE